MKLPGVSKVRYIIVRHLSHYPDLEETTAPSSTPQEEHTQASAIKVSEVPEQPPVSVQ